MQNTDCEGVKGARRRAMSDWKEIYETDDLTLLNIFSNLARKNMDRREAGLEIMRRLLMIDPLLNHDHDDSGECSKCGSIVCPFGESLHFHHDGCPACCIARGEIGLSPDETSSNAPGEKTKQ